MISSIDNDENRLHDKSLAYSTSALICLSGFLLLPLISLELLGQSKQVAFLGCIELLWASQYKSLAFVVLITAFILPFLNSILVFFLSVYSSEKYIEFNSYCRKIVLLTKEWGMLDVFIVSILVSLIKLVEMADVVIEPGLILLVMSYVFQVCSMATMARLNGDKN